MYAFRTGTTVYSEALLDGRLVGEGWNGAGFLPVQDLVTSERLTGTGADAFALGIDGVLLAHNWEFSTVQTRPMGDGFETILELTHRNRAIDVGVHTTVDGTAILRRWLTIHNRGPQPAAIARADPWSGVLWERTVHEKLGGAVGAPDFRLGYFADDRWEHEGRFAQIPLADTGARITGRYLSGPAPAPDDHCALGDDR